MLNNPLFKIPFRYGLLGGLTGSIAITVLYFMGRHPFLLPIVLDFRIIIFSVFIFFSLREVRDYFQEGILYFWQGMVGSYVVIIVSGIIGALFTLALATWNSQFVPSYIEKLEKQMQGYKDEIIKSVGIEAYNQQLAKLPLTSPFDMASDYFLKSLIIGLFLAIVFSVIVRRTPKTPE